MKWFLEIVQNFDGSYYCNMLIENKRVEGIEEYIDYMALTKSIKKVTGIDIVKKKYLNFQSFKRKRYAYIDATQYRKNGCVVTLDEIVNGWKPKWNEGDVVKNR